MNPSPDSLSSKDPRSQRLYLASLLDAQGLCSTCARTTAFAEQQPTNPHKEGICLEVATFRLSTTNHLPLLLGEDAGLP